MQNALPDVLCVVQVALEGAVSKKAALNSLAQGNLPQVYSCACHSNEAADLEHKQHIYAACTCNGGVMILRHCLTCLNISSQWIWLPETMQSYK